MTVSVMPFSIQGGRCFQGSQLLPKAPCVLCLPPYSCQLLNTLCEALKGRAQALAPLHPTVQLRFHAL